MAHAKIDAALATNNTVISGVDGSSIVVDNYVMLSAAPVAVVWKDDTTNISGVMSLTTSVPVMLSCSDPREGVMRTSSGNDLKINLAGAVQVSGHITYHYEGAGNVG